jgi:hypothetical protein
MKWLLNDRIPTCHVLRVNVVSFLFQVRDSYSREHRGCIYCNRRPSRFVQYWGADKSLARPGRKQTTETENFEFHTSYLSS